MTSKRTHQISPRSAQAAAQPYVTRLELQREMLNMEARILDLVIDHTNSAPATAGGASLAADERGAYGRAERTNKKKRKSNPPAPTRRHNENAR